MVQHETTTAVARLGRIRRLFARVIGLLDYIKELESTVEQLSWDGPFGMCTRGAFLRLCDFMPRDQRAVAFIDLVGVHDLNKQHGFEAVDALVRSLFSIPFRRSDIVARWYSGDEIVIVFDGGLDAAVRKIDELQTKGAQVGVDFDHRLGVWDVGKESVSEVVGRLSEQVILDKEKRGGRDD